MPTMSPFLQGVLRTTLFQEISKFGRQFPLKAPARRVTELVSMRFLRERIRLTLVFRRKTQRRYSTRLDPIPSESLIPPKTVNSASLKKYFIAKVESAARPLDAELADTFRRAVNTILQQAKPPKPDVTKEQQEAHKNLKEDNSIMALPADKGRASVVLDADTYDANMSALIDSERYQLLNKEPTDRLTRKLSEKLLTLKRKGHISEAVYNKIRPRHKQPPRVYGLPKIHKAYCVMCQQLSIRFVCFLG